MYLPYDLPNTRVLITVKTYPLPSGKYEELVCTAGLLSDGRWIRIYPVPFRALPYEQQYSKYNWLELSLIRNPSDFRPESYRPSIGPEDFRVVGSIPTNDSWAERKSYILKNVYTSITELIALAKGPEKRSLATLKPREIIDLVIEDDEREWKPQWEAKLQQLNFFDTNPDGTGRQRRVVRKLPFKYSYLFLTDGDTKPRKLMIEDWEIAALFWKCLAHCEGDEAEANKRVRERYLTEFVAKKDLYFFLGTTKQYHNVAQNPFVIIGVFYPPNTYQPSLF